MTLVCVEGAPRFTMEGEKSFDVYVSRRSCMYIDNIESLLSSYPVQPIE